MRVKEVRLEKNISQNKLSQISGVSRQAISFIENGVKSPTLSTLYKLAAALDVPVNYLIDDAPKAANN